MSTTVATAPTPAATTTVATAAIMESVTTMDLAPAPTADAVLSTTVDDATYVMNAFSTLLEGDLYDDELNEISTLFAPAVSDDEEGSKTSSPVPTSGDYETHPETPGYEVAVTAAAIDCALGTTITPTLNNKRTFDEAMVDGTTTEEVSGPPQHKRCVTLDGTKRITLLSSCGAADAVAPVPESPKSVMSPTVVPSSPAPSIPDVASLTPPTVAVEPKKSPAKAKKTVPKAAKSAPTITIRQGMTPEEKAKACRERNREHARKTRLRKKAYVDELKRSLNEMVEERDATAAAGEQKAKIMEQNRDVRFQVMQDFLNLRGNNESNPQRWAAILVPEEFSLQLPVTDFQTMVAAPDGKQQLLTGVENVMADACYFASFLQTLALEEAASPIYFKYMCSRDSYMMDGTQALFNFDGISCGAMAAGASAELRMTGTFRASFCAETNRLRSAQFMFDTGSVRYQLALQQPTVVVKTEA